MNDTNEKTPICPCGARMVLRHNRKLKKNFFGCSNYPECTNTHSADNDGAPLGIPADAETRKLRTELKEELNKYFDTGDRIQDVGDRGRFLEHYTGETRVARLHKDQIRKLLMKLRK